MFLIPVFVGFMSLKPKLCKNKEINTWDWLNCGPWIYILREFNFLSGIVEINELFQDIQFFCKGLYIAHCRCTSVSLTHTRMASPPLMSPSNAIPTPWLHFPCFHPMLPLWLHLHLGLWPIGTPTASPASPVPPTHACERSEKKQIVTCEHRGLALNRRNLRLHLKNEAFW